jgi:hypothetical protein
MDWQNRRRTPFPIFSVDHQRAEICPVAEIHLENQVRDLVADWPGQWLLREYQEVEI